MSAPGLALSMLIGVALGFFGGGGSILTVPLLVYVFGLEPKAAIASSLLVVGLASLSGAWAHWRAGNVEVRTGTLFGTAGLFGAYLGARASAYVDGSLLLLLFAAMMILSALAMWRGRRIASVTTPVEGARTKLLAQGFGVGLLTGLVGAGGGFLIVPALSLWAGLPIAIAVGTSLVVIVLNTVVGFIGHAGDTRVDYALVAAISAAAVVGSFFGSKLSHRVDPAKLRHVFAIFVLLVATFVLVRETDVWLETARMAMPATLSQLAFVLIVLTIGIAMGRITRKGGGDALGDRWFSEGGGI